MRLAHSYSAIKQYENCPLRYYRQRILRDVTDEGGEASRYGERIHSFLERRLRDNEPLPDEAKQYEELCQQILTLSANAELYIEKELVLTDELTPTLWWEPDAWLRSKIDVLIVRGRRALVMDWKTGKRNPDFFQMQLFAAQVLKHYPDVQHVKTSLVWLKTGEVDSETYNRTDINETWADIMRRIRTIYVSYEHDNWPARPSGLCRYCPARHDCDFAKL